MKPVIEPLAPELVKPTGTKVYLQPIRTAKTPGGLLLPQSASSTAVATPRAWVVAVGPDCKQGLQRGDLVLSLALEQCHEVRYYDEDSDQPWALKMVEEDSILGKQLGYNYDSLAAEPQQAEKADVTGL